MVCVAGVLDVGDDLPESSVEALEFPLLVIGVAREDDGAVVGHAYLVAIGECESLFAEHASECPYGVAGLCAAGYDGEDIGLRVKPQAGDEVPDSRRHVEVIRRIDQSDAFLGREVVADGIDERHDGFVQCLRDVSRDSQAVACT